MEYLIIIVVVHSFIDSSFRVGYNMGYMIFVNFVRNFFKNLHYIKVLVVYDSIKEVKKIVVISLLQKK